MPALLPRRAGVCDTCSSPLVQRADDRLETVRERLRLYDAVTAPVIEHYRARGDGALLEFELTSGVADMWPRLEEVVRRQWMSVGVAATGAPTEHK